MQTGVGDFTHALDILPSLLWFGLAVIVLLVNRDVLRQVLVELARRLRSGAAFKIASMEVGAIVVSPGAVVSPEETQLGVRSDTGGIRARERESYRARARDVMVVHRVYKSSQAGQVYDIVIYILPHKRASLAGITRVEYFLGSYWGDKIFPSIDRSRGFAIATAAYGPLLCTAEVFFNDDTSVMLHRYLDFEMGAFAPMQPIN